MVQIEIFIATEQSANVGSADTRSTICEKKSYRTRDSSFLEHLPRSFATNANNKKPRTVNEGFLLLLTGFVRSFATE